MLFLSFTTAIAIEILYAPCKVPWVQSEQQYCQKTCSLFLPIKNTPFFDILIFDVEFCSHFSLDVPLFNATCGQFHQHLTEILHTNVFSAVFF